MPDDRPVSPEERLREALKEAQAALHRACLMLGSTDGFRADFDAIHAALSTPAGPSPDQDLTADRSSGGAGDQDGPESACASSPRPDSTTAPPAAPSPREEAVEALREALVRTRNALHRACLGLQSTEGFRDDFAAANAALSAARPSSPTPEETP